MKKFAVLLGSVLIGMSMFAADVVNNDLIPKVSGELRTRVEVGNTTEITKDKDGKETKKTINNYFYNANADRARLILSWTKTLGIVDMGIGTRMNLAGATNYMEVMQLDKTFIKVNAPIVSIVYQANKDELELGGLNYIFTPNNAKDNLSLEYDTKNAINPIFITADSTTGTAITAKLEGLRFETKIADNLLVKVAAVVDMPSKGNKTVSEPTKSDLKLSTINTGFKVNGVFTIDKDSYIDGAVVIATANRKNDISTGSAVVANTFDNSFLGLGIMGKNKFKINDQTSFSLEYEGTMANAGRKSTIYSSSTTSAATEVLTADTGLYAKATYSMGMFNPYLQATARTTNVKDNVTGKETQVKSDIAITPGIGIVVDKLTFETELNFAMGTETNKDKVTGNTKDSKETGGFYIRERLKYKF